MVSIDSLTLNRNRTDFFLQREAPDISTLYLTRKMDRRCAHKAMMPSIAIAIDPSRWRQMNGSHSRVTTVHDQGRQRW